MSKGLPVFSTFKPELAEAELVDLIAKAKSDIDALTQIPNPTFHNLVIPYELLQDNLDEKYIFLQHLNSVKSSDEIRNVFEKISELHRTFMTEMEQNKELYSSFLKVQQSASFLLLSPAEQKIVHNMLLDFKLSGVSLDEEGQFLFKATEIEIDKLKQTFSNNVLDSENAWKLWIKDKEQLKGLPNATIEKAKGKAVAAEKKGEAVEGEYLLGLDTPTYIAILKYAESRALRYAFYEAHQTIASDVGSHDKKFDNTAVIASILAKRDEQAKLLGFKDYVALSLEKKMANDADEVLTFLQNLAQRARPFAEIEVQELKEYAKGQGLEDLEAWDINYYSEKLSQEKYSFSDEKLREFFPIGTVLNGLFSVAKQLYGISVEEKKGVDVWNEAVRFFEVKDKEGELRGQFYLDPYARENKKNGAWMNAFRSRYHIDGVLQTPISIICADFRPAVGDDPALLSHSEVKTIFHEFGHGLHHMLTKVNYRSISGINGVAWDAVEQPSQFMENFVWEQAVLSFVSGHYKTHEPISEDLIAQMLKSKNYHSAMGIMRQLQFGLIDMRLYQAHVKGHKVDVNLVVQGVVDEISVYKQPDFNRVAHAFSHILSGGYAAGYYSYLWAELLSSDVYSRFEEEGILNPNVGNDFLKCILEKGGSEDPMSLFVQFRGRKPTIDALLTHNGLKASAEPRPVKKLKLS